MSKLTRRERANQEIDKLLELFESGEIPEAVARVVIPPLDVPCARWSLSNKLLTMMAGTIDARGFRQWEEVGRHVKKGSRAFYILAPRFKKMKDEGTDEEESRLIGFLAVPVFRCEDTDGEPLDHPPLEPPEPPPLAEIAEAWGISVAYVPCYGGYYGRYSPSNQEIILATHEESVFFHELAHAAHGRFKKLKGGQDWRQEVVAELTAAVLMRLFGKKDTRGTHYEYIRSYAEGAGKDVRRACLFVLSDVGKCLDLILDHEVVAVQAA